MLTSAQLTTLKNDLAANTNTILISGFAVAINALTPAQMNNVDVAQAVADLWYNLNASPAFWVWQPNASLIATGMALKMSDVGNLTSANSGRLQDSFQCRPGGFTPSNQDDRSLFGSLFSVSGAAGTRANLIAIWQRLATYAEKLFASGTGTQVTGDLNSDGTVSAGNPATLSFAGALTGTDVTAAYNGHY